MCAADGQVGNSCECRSKTHDTRGSVHSGSGSFDFETKGDLNIALRRGRESGRTLPSFMDTSRPTHHSTFGRRSVGSG